MLVAGANLFGQWGDSECIISSFRSPTGSDKDSFDINKSELSHISWSYNIFRCAEQFYVTGTWRGEENKVVKVNLPDECNVTNKYQMIGNDYRLIVIDKETPSMWVLDFKNGSFRKVNFAIEKPLDNLAESVDAKRQRLHGSIIKSVVNNDSALFLTADGLVYCSLLPSFLDTSHCEGKVCDVQCGYEHFMLLTAHGNVYTWGNGGRLQLGHNELVNLESPALVEALAGVRIVKIRAGGWHCLALSDSGDLYVWGWNDIGQLGIKPLLAVPANSVPDFKSEPLPALVDFYNESGMISMNVRDIAAGTRHSTVVLEDNSVWTTGNNKYGQCGFPPESREVVSHFTKAYQCDDGYELLSGPWATVLRRATQSGSSVVTSIS